MNREIAFDKIQCPFLIQTLNRLEAQGNLLILVKGTYKKEKNLKPIKSTQNHGVLKYAHNVFEALLKCAALFLSLECQLDSVTHT